MAITFYVDLIVGEYIDLETNPNFKLYMFLAIVFIQGFVNTLLQTVMTRYVFNFSSKDVASYTAGTALAGVGTSL